jgi:hypothetical protein
MSIGTTRSDGHRNKYVYCLHITKNCHATSVLKITKVNFFLRSAAEVSLHITFLAIEEFKRRILFVETLIIK